MSKSYQFVKLAVLIFLFSVADLVALNVGLCVVATGKYTCFVPPLLQSARTFFCPTHTVTFFIFTDGVIEDASEDVVVLPHKRYGWPYDTMFRYFAYWNHREHLKNMDYVFACDADMLFVDYMGDEILGERVGTMHPGYVGRRGTYENRKESIACVLPSEGECYFAGGLYGGARDVFLEMVQNLIFMMNRDLDRKIIAVWHDESYLNRYLIDHKPSLILPRAYCARPFDKPQKLVALDKDHKEMRSK